MQTVEAGTRIALKNILYLTDFSEPSEAALPFATAIGRGYGANVHALHVLMPTPYVYTTPALTGTVIEAIEEGAQVEMQRVESQLAGLQHETSVERGIAIWPTVEQTIKDRNIDLIVLGTHGRTGAQKFLLGSVAEEIFRRSPVPVLTIGPGVSGSAHNAARFRHVLFASDFSPEASAAAPYAVSLALENQARLVSLHVIPQRELHENKERVELSVAEAIHQLYEVVPKGVEFHTPPEVAVEYGEPAARILDTATERGADLIVLGVRGAAGRLGAATHLGSAIAHNVVAHASCPVLTVRGLESTQA